MDKKSVETGYSKNGAFYKVVLTASPADIFAKAVEQKITQDKEGDELVAALIAFITAPGRNAVLVVDRYRDGLRGDGPNGDPAVQIFDSRGQNVINRHFTEGLLSDGAGGEPALQMYDSKGRLAHAVSYKNGEELKILSEQERSDAQFRIAQKNARPAPPGGKKPGPAHGMG